MEIAHSIINSFTDELEIVVEPECAPYYVKRGSRITFYFTEEVGSETAVLCEVREVDYWALWFGKKAMQGPLRVEIDGKAVSAMWR